MNSEKKITAVDVNSHGGDLETASKQFNRKNFLDFSININPWGPPLKLWFTLIANFPGLKEYPQPYADNCREFLARFFKIDAGQLALGNGAAELIRHLPEVLPVERGVILEPTFTEYKQAFVNAGKPVLKIALDSDFQLPLAKISSSVQAGDLLFICQPNNPTGGLFKEKELIRVLDLLKERRSWLVIDESFIWFSGKIRELSFYRYLRDYPNLIIINSLTKIGAIPGLRLGFIISGPEIAGSIRNKLDQWNVNRLAQKALPIILDPVFLENTLKNIKQENNWLQQELKTIPGLEVFPWDANFYLVKLETGSRADRLIRNLGTEGVLVRDCSNFDGLGPEYFRVAVGSRRCNKIFLKKLRRLMEL